MSCSKLNSQFKTEQKSAGATTALDTSGLNFTSSSATFPTTTTGTSSTATLTLSNSGGSAANGVQAPTTAGTGFSVQSTTCSSSLAAGASCTVTLLFQPLYKGTYTGYVQVAYGSGSKATASLSGAGTNSSALAFTPSSKDFGSVFVGQTSVVTLGVTNSGTGATGILTVTTTDGAVFPITSTDCNGATLPASGTCQVLVTFTPAAASAYSGQIIITDADSGLSIVAGMIGQGVVPSLLVSPSSYDFGGMVIGGQASRSFTVTNSSAIAVAGLNLMAIGSGYTLQSNDCASYSSSLAAGASCTVDILFSPPGSGAFNGYLAASANGQPSVTSTLTGSAASAANLSFTPGSNAFGTVFTSLSPSFAFTLSNSGGTAASALSISLSDTTNYSQSNNCGGTVAGSNNCAVTVTYHPTNESSHPLTVTASYNNGVVSKTTTATASGTGRFPPVLAMTPSSYNYGNLTVGNTASAQFTLSNSGTGYASGLSITTSDPSFWISSNTCPSPGSFAAGASCVITVEFSPMQLTSYSKALTVDYAERTPLGNALVSSALQGVGANGLAWNTLIALPLNSVGLRTPVWASPGKVYLNDRGGSVSASSDGGLTWTRQATGLWNSMYGLAFNGMDLLGVGSSGSVWKNVGAGLHWQNPTPGTISHVSLACPSSSFCWGGGSSSGSAISTSNGGTSWSEPTFSTGLGSYTADLSAPDANHLFHLNYSDQGVQLSQDGGASFQPLLGNYSMQVAVAPSSSILYVGGDHGWLRKSLDGGASWRTMPHPARSTINAMTCVSTTMCWTGHSNGTVYRTLDGGSTWTLQRTFTNSVASIFAWDSNVLYAGYLYYIWRSTDGGVTWTQAMTPSFSSYVGRILCSSATHCIARFGATNGDYLETIDGQTWYSIAGGGSLRHLAVQGSTLWAGGELGALRKSTDSGSTWTYLPSPTSESIYAIAFSDASNGWIGTNNGKIFHTSDGGASWSQQTSPTSNSLYAMAFPSSSVGYAVGGNGVLLKTTDGGANWTLTQPAWPNPLYAVHCLSTTQCWIGGNQKILRTSDGGSTWSTYSFASGWTNTLGLSFADANNGSALVSNALSPIQHHYITTDGGATWTAGNAASSTNDGGGRVLFASDGLHGWLVTGGGIMKYTTNGGASWSNSVAPTYPYSAYSASQHILMDLAIVDQSDLNSVDLVATTSMGSILKTIDGGVNWTQVNVGDLKELTTFTFAPGSATAFWLGFRDSANRMTFLKTTDGGASFTVNGTTITSLPYGMTALDANRLITGASTGGTAFVSSDAGANWSSVTSGITGGTYALYGAVATGGLNALAFGSTGALLVSADAGASWSRTTHEPVSTLSGIDFIDPNQGWVVGYGGKIYSTGDGGLTWSSQTSGTAMNLYGVDFVDANTGMAVGASQTAIRTTDGGATWVAQTPGLPSMRNWDLRYIKLKDANTGIATGNITTSIARLSGGNAWTDVTALPPNYNIVFNRMHTFGRKNIFLVSSSGYFSKSTDGGHNWTTVQLTGSPTLQSVHFVSLTNGWAVATNNRIYATTDGGATWTTQYTGTQPLNDLYFTDTTHGWAVGNNGTIVATADGSTWSTQSSGTTQVLRGVTGIPGTNTLWTIGAAGTILKSTDGSSWSAQTSGTANGLYGISMASATTGWAVGASGTLLYTTDGGANWGSQSSGTTQQLNSVHAVDGNRVFVVGNSATLIQTTNGGVAWTAAPSMSSYLGSITLNHIVFADSQVGYLIGNISNDSILMTTKNGGIAP